MAAGGAQAPDFVSTPERNPSAGRSKIHQRRQPEGPETGVLRSGIRLIVTLSQHEVRAATSMVGDRTVEQLACLTISVSCED